MSASKSTDRRRPLVFAEVDPRQALQMDEADENAQYEKAKDSVEASAPWIE